MGSIQVLLIPDLGIFGPETVFLTSGVIKITSFKPPYWRLNENENVSLRDTLGT